MLSNHEAFDYHRPFRETAEVNNLDDYSVLLKYETFNDHILFQETAYDNNIDNYFSLYLNIV